MCINERQVEETYLKWLEIKKQNNFLCHNVQ